MIPKYRGRSISEENKGQWVYGNLIVDGGCAYIVNGVIECNDQYITIAEWCPVDPKTVGASTGLFDKNSVEIFEGDFIVLDELTYVVKQGIHKFSRFEGVGFYLLIDMEDIYIVDPMVTDGNRLEVIGNIHEHPHLVEGGG